MDNLASHKVAGIRSAIEAAGAELRYLPFYSPDFNPIEQFFARLKALLRKAAARTVDALIAAIADVLTTVTPQECANYLANQGYRHNHESALATTDRPRRCASARWQSAVAVMPASSRGERQRHETPRPRQTRAPGSDLRLPA
jgi:hypothetical protein